MFRNGALTGIRYKDGILHPIARPFAGAMDTELVLMDDNARPLRAQIVNKNLEVEPMERMEWPSMSPDLNPFEHVCDALKRHIQQQYPAPSPTNELEVALWVEWDCNAQRAIRSLIQISQGCAGLLFKQREATQSIGIGCINWCLWIKH